MAGKDIVITWPSLLWVSNLVDATCYLEGYQETLGFNPDTGEPIPNPQTKQQFARQYWADRMIDEIAAWKRRVVESQYQPEPRPTVVVT